MNPYMAFVLEPLVETLEAFSASTLDNQTFWICALETIAKSLTFDDGGL
jgi:hypothetical protein